MNNLGTKYVERRGINSYRLNVQVDKHPNGDRIFERKNVPAKSKEEAMFRLEEFTQELLGQSPKEITSDSSFEEYALDWLLNYAKEYLAPKTVAGYRTILMNWLIPYFGKLQLQELTPHIVRRYYLHAKERKSKYSRGGRGLLSPQTIQHHHRLLHKMMQDAHDDDLITRNPVTKKYAPRVPRRYKFELKDDFLPRLIQAAEKEKPIYHLLILLTLATGMRLGEVLALQWKHVFFQTKSLEVRQAIQYLPEKGTFIKSVKNMSSNRVLGVANSVILLLQHHRQMQPNKGDEAYVFSYPTGEPLKPHLTSNWFARFAKHHQLGQFRFHDLRHLSATLALQSGAPLANVSSRLGHARVTTTLDIYSHAIQSVDHSLAESFDKIISENTTPSDKQTKGENPDAA